MEHELNPLEAIEKKLAEAIARDSELHKEIDALRQAAKVLGPIYRKEAELLTDHFHIEIEDVMGITDAVRAALRVPGGKLTAPQVRDVVASRGFDLSGYRNAMATIHQVLRRLVEAGQAEAESIGDSKATYRWIGGGTLQQLAGVHPAYLPSTSDPLTVGSVRAIHKAATERAVKKIIEESK